MESIFLLEDDQTLGRGIVMALEAPERTVTLAGSLREGRAVLAGECFDLLILDINLPDGSGLELLRQLRAVGDRTPVILLTANDLELDEVTGLEAGADDYITKPFNILEVKARIKAIMRRSAKKNKKAAEPENKVVTAGDLKLDVEGRRVFIADREINLTAKEFDLLELLVCHPNKVYSRESLLTLVWGNKALDTGDVRTVDVHVRRLREKIEPSPSDPRYVHTKWGVGYYFRVK